MAADFVAQMQTEDEQVHEDSKRVAPSSVGESLSVVSSVDWRRNFAYILCGSLYQGIAQEITCIQRCLVLEQTFAQRRAS